MSNKSQNNRDQKTGRTAQASPEGAPCGGVSRQDQVATAEILDTIERWRKWAHEWSGSAFVSGEKLPKAGEGMSEDDHKSELYSGLCRLGSNLQWLHDELSAALASQPVPTVAVKGLEWEGTEDEQHAARQEACDRRCRQDGEYDQCERDGSCAECESDMHDALSRPTRVVGASTNKTPNARWEREVYYLIRSIAELDDRTSPDDYPDHLLLTPEELKEFAREVAVLSAAVTVKGLEWSGNNAETVVGPYTVVKYHSHFGLVRPGDSFDGFGYCISGDEPTVKAYAQADYEARIRSAIVPAQAVPDIVRPVCRVMTMQHSSGAPDHYVSIEVGDRQITPHKYKIRGRAEYDVAEWNWLLNGGEKPFVLDFDTDPAATHRHLKSGHLVREIGRGFAQVSTHPIEEMTAVAVYEHDGRLWVRNAVEFDDGRFELLVAPAEAG